MDETPQERAKRRRQRSLFDAVAERYDGTRAGYPREIVDELARNAGLSAGAAVLEVGCGTGQLTEDLARRGLSVTALDLGAAMVAGAAKRVEGLDVQLHVGAFEEFDAGDARFAAIVSATAFHWIDPEVAWTKSADLLEPGGWIAILGTAERYDEPLGPQLREQWVRYSDDGGAWATTPRPTLVEVIAASGRFEPAITSTHHDRRVLPVDVVLALEQTRATFLSYDDATSTRFVADLHRLLDGVTTVPLTQETTLTMARRRT